MHRYIMTSDATLKATKDFFVEHNYFGLSSSAVIFFEQHQLPCVTFEGKLMLASHGVYLKFMSYLKNSVFFKKMISLRTIYNCRI